MQVTRDERLAKLQAFSMLAGMALVAVTVHFWPRQTAVVMTSLPAVSAPATVAMERQAAPRAVRRVSAPNYRPVPRPVVSVQAVRTQPPRVSDSFSGPTLASLSGPALASLPSLPGTSMAMSAASPPLGSDLDYSGRENRDLTPTGGAVTRAMQTTRSSLAGAFKKTGSALRRAF